MNSLPPSPSKENSSPVIEGASVRRRRIGFVAATIALLATAGWFGWSYYDHHRPENRIARAQAALKAGDWQTVEVEADQLQKTRGYLAHAHLLRGEMYLKRDHPADAFNELSGALEHPDTRAAAHRLSGEALYRLGHWHSALPFLQTAVTLEPDNADAHRWLAAVYYDIGAMNLALDHLVRLSELDPGDARPLRLQGLILKDFEQYSEAVEAYQRALEHADSRVNRQEIRSELAECLVELHEYDRALKTLAECEETPDVHALRGRCQYALGQRDAARQLAERALQINPDHTAAVLLRAQIARDEKDVKRAIELLTHGTEAHPKDFEFRWQLSQALGAAGETERAAEELEEMRRLKDLRRQFTDLHEKALLDTDNADLRYEIGQVALELDRDELAAAWFQAALAINPQHQRAQHALQSINRSSR